MKLTYRTFYSSTTLCFPDVSLKQIVSMAVQATRTDGEGLHLTLIFIHTNKQWVVESAVTGWTCSVVVLKV